MRRSSAGAYTAKGLSTEPGWRAPSSARLKPRRTSYARPPTMASTSPVRLSMSTSALWQGVPSALSAGKSAPSAKTSSQAACTSLSRPV